MVASMAFLGSFLQYIIIMVILLFLAGCGIFLGKYLRDRKDAKEALKEKENNNI